MTPHILGIVLSVSTLFLWSVGDFYIQKSTRLIGIWKSLFFISLIGSILLFPFVWSELPALINDPRNLLLLLVLCFVVLFAALFDFEALKRGKIAIIEPIFGLEIPITVALGVSLGYDSLTALQLFLITVVFIGVILSVSSKDRHIYKKTVLEKGVILAGLGTVAMALTNFLTGVSSQRVSPFLTIWFINVFMTVLPFVYICMAGGARSLFGDFKKYFKVVMAESLFDNAAWISYAYAMTLIPISIVTTISQSYVALTVLLGVSINKEKLTEHQWVGIALTILGVIALSALSAY